MKFLCKLFGHSKKGIWVDKGDVYYANAIDVEPTKILVCISCPRCGYEEN